MTLSSVLRVSAVGLLLAGLAFPAAAPEVANVTVAVLAGVGLLTSLGAKTWGPVLRQPAVWLPLAAGVVLALAFAVTARSALDVAAVFYFTPVFAVAPLVLLLDRIPTRGWLECSAALLGVIAAAVVASYDAFILDVARAGESVANPIHFADITLMLGFVAVTGAILAPPRWRWVYLLGPLIAGYCVYLSGSRGPMLALLLLIAGALGYRAIVNFSRGESWIRAALITIVYCALAVLGRELGWLDRFGRASTMAVELQAVAGMGVDASLGADSSTVVRLDMYRTALAAFLDSPLFGHGLVDFIAKTARYAPEGVNFPIFEHLHNDIADFAVIGGVMGLLAYGMLLLAPIVQAVRAPPGRQRSGVLLLALSASGGYFAMGLTNAMFGLLTHTILYAVMLALVTHLSRPAATAVNCSAATLPFSGSMSA
ncbi:MAG TPA: O-antigen ligase family protein [Devosia sp.]|nr:O-antigen ligase family protein [Devosia sp.]